MSYHSLWMKGNVLFIGGSESQFPAMCNCSLAAETSFVQRNNVTKGLVL